MTYDYTPINIFQKINWIRIRILVRSDEHQYFAIIYSVHLRNNLTKFIIFRTKIFIFFSKKIFIITIPYVLNCGLRERAKE